jgi:hypothetical protein
MGADVEAFEREADHLEEGDAVSVRVLFPPLAQERPPRDVADEVHAHH